jgi:site-specific DNA recombinase
MKKAVLYARVSSDLQRKEKTIDSQVVELKKQIAATGDILVKKYIDDGFSGARLDRPAMNQLREDLKSNLFDTIYFLNTDRIAREVTYQTIIIGEILKHKKQVIINGKDYIHDPENKFALTVLGAVAELERAKIIERVTRAKQLRIAQGFLLACGNNIYGYDYHRRTPDSAPFYTINETEAKVVKYVFETYSKGGVGMNQITRHLERINAPTKRGRGLWRISILKGMLNNEMYTGIRYFNTMRRIREYANPINGIKHTTSRVEKRDRSEWVGVKVPHIVSQELFDKVKERLEWNRKRYRNPQIVQLLSSLVRCGCCDSSMFAYHRFYKDKRVKIQTVMDRVSYKCNYRLRLRMHAKETGLQKCTNMEVKAQILESHVFGIFKDTVIDPVKLKDSMDFFKRRTQATQLRFEKQLKALDLKIKKVHDAKKRMLELYTDGELDREVYVKKNIDCDYEVNTLKNDRIELLKQIPLLHKKDLIDTSIKQYCETVRVRLEQVDDFETKRQFLLDYVDKIVYWNEKVELHGSVPVKLKIYENRKETTELAKITFCVKDTISLKERFGRKNRQPNFSVQITRNEFDSLNDQRTY